MKRFQLSRALPRARGKPAGSSHQSLRCITTAPAERSIETPPYIPGQIPASLPHGESAQQPTRRQAIRDTKPFSEFLTDNFNRQHDYLRISVTEQCNLRCLYCMPEEGVELTPKPQLLTTPEIYYLSSLFVSQGVTKIRLTGGEPTVRKDIVTLMQQIGSLRSNGLRELALTTNGISLHRKLDAMVEAGLTGINISLDTLDPFQFQIMTRRKGFDAVMKSIDKVLELNRHGAGVKLKINCVVMRGMNEKEIIPFVELGREQNIEVRFIEYMPFGGNKWAEKKMVSYQEMVDMIRQKYPGLERLRGHKNDTSKTYQVPGFVGKVGFITSMTHNFCGTCNRLRITSDGNLKVCLHGNTEVSLRDMLRKGNNAQPIDEEAFEAIKEVEMNRCQGLLSGSSNPSWSEHEMELLDTIGMAVKRKKEKHAGMGALENMKNRPMILIDKGRILSGLPVQQQKPAQWPSLFSGRGPRAVPLHLLSHINTASSGLRAYSSDSEHNRSAGDRSSFANKVTNSDGVDIEPEQSKPSTAARIVSGLGFQSLSSLFEAPPSGRYSRPRVQSRDGNSMPTTDSSAPAGIGPLEQMRAEPDMTKTSGTSGTDKLFSSRPVPNQQATRETPSSAKVELPQVDQGVLEGQTRVRRTKRRDDYGSVRRPPLQGARRLEPGQIKTAGGKTAPLSTQKLEVSRTECRLRMTVPKVGSDEVNHRLETRTTSPIRKFVSPDLEASKDDEMRSPYFNDAIPSSAEEHVEKDESSPPRPWGTRPEPVKKDNRRIPLVSGPPATTLSTWEQSSNTSASNELVRYQRSRPDDLTSRDPIRVVDADHAQDSALLPLRSSDLAVNQASKLTHVNESGAAHMVDVGSKASTKRIAIAHGYVTFSNDEPYRLINENSNKKGDVIGTARIAAIMAAKRCADIIPLCHPIPLSSVTVDIKLYPAKIKSPLFRDNYNGTVTVTATAQCTGPTGVEMEALTAVAGGCLTVFDMCKAVDRRMVIGPSKILYKAGGRSGDYFRHGMERDIIVDMLRQVGWNA